MKIKMLFKNKEQQKETLEDKNLRDLFIRILELRKNLQEQVYNIITKNNVIKIYPNGADKDKAIKDADYAKRYLLCIIGEYDDLKNQYVDYFNKTKNKRIRTIYYEYDLIDSHTIIENAYKDYYKYKLR